jgi:hypothetical protein
MTIRTHQGHLDIQRLGVCPKRGLAFASIESGEFAARVLRLLEQTPSIFKADLGEEVRPEKIDLLDPRSAGWIFVVGSDDPRKREISSALRRLANHRGMPADAIPLELDATEKEWAQWIQDQKVDFARRKVKFPRYLLLAGSPENLPFRFQSMLASTQQVGRVDFDSIEDLQAYIDKVIRIESATAPMVDRSAVFFGTDHGPGDATYHTLRHMLEPLAARCRAVPGFEACEVKAEEATRARLIDAVTQRKCALLYVASHGLCLGPEHSSADRRSLNGAVVCKQSSDGSAWLAADDIPEAPFLEGGVFFQFSCHGYGTPNRSDFDRWLPEVSLSPPQPVTPFVAALPKRLLVHPRGPVAYIGHVDSAFVHAFMDPEDPAAKPAWQNRLFPFSHALDELLRVKPAALAMSEMSTRFVHANGQIVDRISRQSRDELIESASDMEIANSWIHRTDAQNYFVLGDPAARLRIPA